MVTQAATIVQWHRETGSSKGDDIDTCTSGIAYMTTTSCIDPLELGKRVMSILHTGRRTATYKLATLSALIEYCEQYAPLDDPCASIDVPVDDLADRVIKMYWRQVEPLADEVASSINQVNPQRFWWR